MGTGAGLGVIAAALALLAGGCADTRVGPQMGGVGVPVMFGPVIRLGGGAAEPDPVVQTVEGEACRTIVATSSSSSQNYGSYRVTTTTTTTSTSTSDNVASGIVTASLLAPGCVVTVKGMKVVQHYHISLFAWGSQYVWLQSEVRRTGAGGGRP